MERLYRPSPPCAMVVAEYNIYIPTVVGRRNWDCRECCVTNHGSDVIRTTECQPEMMMFRQLNSPWLQKEGYTITSFPRYNIERRWLICRHGLWLIRRRCDRMDRQTEGREHLQLLLRPILQVPTEPYFRNHIIGRGPKLTNY